MQSAEETKKRFMEAMQKRKKMEEQSRLAKDALENKLKDAEERRLTLSQPSEERGRRMEAAQQKLRQMKYDVSNLNQRVIYAPDDGRQFQYAASRKRIHPKA